MQLDVMNPSPSSSARETRRAERRPTPQRARRRAPLPAAKERHAAKDLDDLYLAEMGKSTLLTPAKELEVGARITNAERTVLVAVASSAAGKRALTNLAEELERGDADIRDILLNPDQEGLDLVRAQEDIRVALASAAAAEPERSRDGAASLAERRFDPEVVASLVGAVRASFASAERDPHDDQVLRAVARAERELKRAKEELVIGNLRLVVLFARKYLGRGVPLLDLVQEGNLGLLRAAEKFDHRRGFRFSTYAAWWIKQSLQRALLDRTLRLPVHVADDRRRIGRARATFTAQHRREATAEELASKTGLSRDRVDNILSLPLQPTSLDAPVGTDGDANLGDFVASNDPGPENEAALHALGGQLTELLALLTPREAEVLRLRFGLASEDHPRQRREHTLEEVGKLLGLTRERIRQIERHALDKLRVRSDRVELRSYLVGR